MVILSTDLKTGRYQFKNNNRILEIMLSTFGGAFTQSIHKLSEKVPPRIFLACYWLFVITTVATWSGNLVAMLTVKKTKLPVNSLEDVLDHPTYQIGMEKGSAILSLFKV